MLVSENSIRYMKDYIRAVEAWRVGLISNTGLEAELFKLEERIPEQIEIYETFNNLADKDLI